MGVEGGRVKSTSQKTIRHPIIPPGTQSPGFGGFSGYAGQVDGDLRLDHVDSAKFEESSGLAGGTIGGAIRLVGAEARLTIYGTGFEVDGTPVPYGELTATSGVLTGSLFLGGALDNAFRHGGAACGVPPTTCAGTILLAPPSDELWTVIANGLAPPEPGNVVDTDLAGVALQVRDAGCAAIPAAPRVACTTSGTSTVVELVTGSITPLVLVNDTASQIATGGSHEQLMAFGDSHVQ